MTIQQASSTTTPPKKPSYHLRISEAFNYSTGGRNTGLGITVPSPVYPPSILFSSKFKFCFYSKKKTTPTKHTAFVQKTLTGFLATRHQGCVLLKWYFDRQCNTYFTEQIFI